ncbi:hypothetical protein PROH_02975 [Prochlorothrix hollandica PCC 9006 = CALU 1027]|uniref:DUF1517 domain-containing protein n=1 Tax=Prochlorothrix hollandica PCC 9006 = CALU 1027 TaxID=317619 RepID=A0A0M2Q248_PROHO|nr:hypothetical protein PROH_02975 [Prochlorothrix hollandica PCC 9006 = CALU 1027]
MPPLTLAQGTPPLDRDQPEAQDDSRYSGNGSYVGVITIAAIAAIFGTAIVAVLLANRPLPPDATFNFNPDTPPSPKPPSPALEPTAIAVTLIQVALVNPAPQLWTQLQDLMPAAAQGNPVALQDLSLWLLRLSDSWSHGHLRSQPLEPGDSPTQTQQQWSLQERGKFKGEPDLPNSPDTSDPQYLVVTLVITTTQGLPSLGNFYDGEVLAKTLEYLGSLQPSQVVRLDCIWSPPTPRLTADDLLARYPDLLPL